MGRYRVLSTGITLAVALFFVRSANADGAGIDTSQAARYFAEARALSERDHGRLWGVEVYGPMLLADPDSRAMAGNQLDSAGVLAPAGSVFTGQAPPDLNIANTAVHWSGKEWTMVRWPLPRDPEARAILMAHELWHRVQDALGFPVASPDNAHLDTAEGRLWMRLEWRALSAALGATGTARAEAIRDALVFRGVRRKLFAGAATTERALEMNEGLASYTGARLGTTTDATAIAAARSSLSKAEGAQTYVRSFAYATGPAYGLLLDATRPKWRQGLEATNDLSDLLAAALGVRPATDLQADADRRAGRYGGDSLRTAERRRGEARQVRLREARQRFVEGPVLTAPLRKSNVSFDPGTLLPLDSLGTVYPSIRVTDEWGVLEASKGALVSADWTWIRIPAPDSTGAARLRGDGWTLQLGPGWRVVSGGRSGHFVLEKAK